MTFKGNTTATIESIEKHLKETDWAGRRPESVQFWFGTTQITLVNEKAVMECMIARLKCMKGPYAGDQPCAQHEFTRDLPLEIGERFAKRYRIHPGANGPRINQAVQ